MIDLKAKIREIPDWSEKWVNFKDTTSLLQDKEASVYALEIIEKIPKDYRCPQCHHALKGAEV